MICRFITVRGYQLTSQLIKFASYDIFQNQQIGCRYR